jgi:hypothetical protein
MMLSARVPILLIKDINSINRIKNYRKGTLFGVSLFLCFACETPLSLRDISPKGAKILVLLVELALSAEFSPLLGECPPAGGRGGIK